MANKTCKCRFFLLLLLLLFSLLYTTSGTAVGFAYDAGGITGSSSYVKTPVPSLKKLNKVFPSLIRVLATDYDVLDILSHTDTGALVDIYLNNTLFANMANESPLLSCLNTHLRSYIPRLNINSVTVGTRSINDFSGANSELQLLLSTLRTTYSFLTSLQLKRPIKLYVAFPLSSLIKTLNTKQTRELDQIFRFLETSSSSYLVLEDHIDIDVEQIKPKCKVGGAFLNSFIDKANGLVTSLLSHTNVPIVLSVNFYCKSPMSTQQLSFLRAKIVESRPKKPLGRIVGLLLAISLDYKLDLPLSLSSSSPRRELIAANFVPKDTKYDSYDPSTPITNPTTMPSNIPPYTNPTPTIITVPSTNPGTFPPTNPSSVPVTVPSSTPVTTPTNPFIYPGAQPVTNPVTTYPNPLGNTVPPTNPVTTPVTSPAVGNPPITAGQTWCVARSGVPESALQSALDYACGIGGADCSTIQQGASCYDPNTLQNHASYAFNSYFQKNPASTSCDFGGAAVLVNTNPSSGSCIYPSSPTTALPSSSPTAALPSIVPPETSSTSGQTGSSGSESPSSIMNASNPASSTIYGSQNPGIVTAPPSGSHVLRPLVCIITLMTSISTGILLGV